MVKDAVLAIPSAVAGTITDVLEALFVPDLSLVQTELDNIGNRMNRRRGGEE